MRSGLPIQSMPTSPQRTNKAKTSRGTSSSSTPELSPALNITKQSLLLSIPTEVVLHFMEQITRILFVESAYGVLYSTNTPSNQVTFSRKSLDQLSQIMEDMRSGLEPRKAKTNSTASPSKAKKMMDGIQQFPV